MFTRESLRRAGWRVSLRVMTGNPFRLDGKAAVVTGASRGIGAAISLAMADAGADVGLVARSRADLDELARQIRARGRNAVAPSVVETASLRSAVDDETRSRIIEATPLRRLAQQEDVAWTVVWLASRASSYVAGQVVDLDGGAHAPTMPSDVPDLDRPARA
jgi:NAD(P)-dependent dehydrogenase (short-subunit alcohol dehydrogenase family)